MDVGCNLVEHLRRSIGEYDYLTAVDRDARDLLVVGLKDFAIIPRTRRLVASKSDAHVGPVTAAGEPLCRNILERDFPHRGYRDAVGTTLCIGRILLTTIAFGLSVTLVVQGPRRTASDTAECTDGESL